MKCKEFLEKNAFECFINEIDEMIRQFKSEYIRKGQYIDKIDCYYDDKKIPDFITACFNRIVEYCKKNKMKELLINEIKEILLTTFNTEEYIFSKHEPYVSISLRNKNLYLSYLNDNYTLKTDLLSEIEDEILLHVYKILIIEDYKTKNILNYGGDITNYRESGSSY